jgi:signal transduction histidine kinase
MSRQVSFQLSPVVLFRWVAALGALALGAQQLAVLAWVAPAAWPALHILPFDLAHGLFGSANATQLASTVRDALCIYALSPLLVAFVLWRADRPVLRGWLWLLPLLGVLFNDKWLLLSAATWAMVLPPRQASLALFGQVAVYVALMLVHGYAVHGGTPLSCALMGNPWVLTPDERWDTLLADVLRMAVFQLLVFGVGWLGSAELRSRRRLAQANAELLATRHLLDEAVRASERLRIARELHDAVGHQLTAINLHLELAVRQAGAEAPLPLGHARELAQRLLAEVRAVVGIERRSAMSGEDA